MNLHNKKTEAIVSDEKVGTSADLEDVHVLGSELVDVNKLAIADEVDTGGDPYNSTGQHVVIKSQLEIDE